MAARTGSPRWGPMATPPAGARSACGGSRLTHDAILSAVNGGPLPTGVAQQQSQSQQGAVSTVPQNGVAQPVPGGSSVTGSVGGGAAGNATSVTGGTAAGGGPVAGGGTSRSGGWAASGPTAARPAGPLAPVIVGNVGTYSGGAGGSLGGHRPPGS